jgi:hypothetical protein
MRKLENKQLDEIGKRLAAADMVPAREIDDIVANPTLFYSVLTRIESEVSHKAPARRSLLRPIIASGSSLALIVVAVFAYITFKTKPTDVVKAPTPASPTTSETKKFPVSDTAVNPNIRTIPAEDRVERIVERPSIRPVRTRQPVAQQARYEENFYALSYAGDPNETERGGRIVRVEIPRSALFAMGVNVPLENENSTVKADLLVGNDGVTRAIRVVE